MLTVSYHYLLEGDTNGRRPRVLSIIPRKCFKFETRKFYFPHSEHPKNKKILTIIYHYLVVEKRNNLNRFCQTRID
jgi:hypothetical protein